MDILLLGLGFGSVGYWISKDGKNTRNYQVRTDLSKNEKPVGEHVYHSDDFNKINQQLQNTLNTNFQKSKTEEDGWVNPELLAQRRNMKVMSDNDRIPNQLNASELEENKRIIEETKKKIQENFVVSDHSESNYLSYSSLDSVPNKQIQQDFVMSNTLPYHSSSNIGSEGLNYNSFLRIDKDSISPEYGPDLQPKNKKDIPTLFKPINQEPYKKLGPLIQKERYEPGINQNNINPFLQDREAPLLADVYQPGQEVSFYRPQPKTIDELRVKDRPILDNQIQIGGSNSLRAEIGDFNQNKKDTFYENPIDRGQITPALSAKKNKQRLNFQIKTDKIVAENYKGISTSALKQPTNRSLYENITNNSSQKKKSSLVFPSQLRNVVKAVSSSLDNKETFTPDQTRRDQQGALTYTPIANFSTNGKTQISEKSRSTKQTLDDESYQSFNNTQISTVNKKPGAYQNKDNFVLKYSSKEFSVKNNYTAPASVAIKSGQYKDLKFKKKRDTQTSLYTPGAQSNYRYNNVEDSGDNRMNVKNSLVQNFLNAGNIKLNEPTSKDYKLNLKRNTGDNNRLFEDSETIKNTYNNDFRPNGFLSTQ